MRLAMIGLIVATLLLTPNAGAQSPSSKDSSSKDGSSKDTTPKKIDKIDGRTLDEWRKRVRWGETNRDASHRTAAVLAIVQFGEEAKVAIPDLVFVIRNDPDVSTRAKAVYAMRFMTIEDKHNRMVASALASRINRLKDLASTADNVPLESQAIVRYEALVAMRRFPKEAHSYLKQIISATEDRTCWEARHQAVANLWNIAIQNADKTEGPDPAVVNALLNVVINAGTYQVRIEALMGLAYMGKPADLKTQSRMINDLKVIAGGPSVGRETPTATTMQIWALAALSRLGEDAGVKSPLGKLTSFLKHKDVEIKRQAAAAMSALGPLAKSKLPVLIKMLDDPEPLAVIGACQAILAIGEKNEELIDRLVKMIDDKEQRNVVTAVGALVMLKENTKKVQDALDAQLGKKDLDRYVRFVIEDAIKELKKKTDDPKKPDLPKK